METQQRREGSTIWRGVKLFFGGCIVMPILLIFAIGLLIMLLAAVNHH